MQNNKAYSEQLIKNLKQNNFEVYLAKSTLEAKEIFLRSIYPSLPHKRVSYADSITLHETGLLEHLKSLHNIDFIETFIPNASLEQKWDKRREALTADLFLTGTNAITEKGQLVNLDMVGNRVAAITFGPKNVVLFIGINKVVKNLEEAFKRVRNIAAPQNAKRHENFKTPCQKTGTCHDCKSPDRICNSWTITEKSFPKGRIKIILIEEELGF